MIGSKQRFNIRICLHMHVYTFRVGTFAGRNFGNLVTFGSSENY